MPIMTVTTKTDKTELSAKRDEMRNPSPTKQTCHSASSPRRKKRETPFLRKAPQAPKRFRSSYICFFTAKQPEIKKELGETSTVADISRRSAYMWKMLSPEDRRYWDNEAAKDKQRYLTEKASYSGPWQIPYKRPKKDPSAPKRPMSAFLHFTRGRRGRIKKENPGMKNTDVSKILGDLWRKSTDEERRPYVDKEKVEREKYKIAMSKWKEGFDKEQKEKSDKLQQSYYQRPSQPKSYQPPSFRHPQQQHVQVKNEYAPNDAHSNHMQQRTQSYPYSDFQPPLTNGANHRRKVSNATDSSNLLTESNCESIGDDSVILDQNYALHNDQVPQYQPSQQPSLYNNFSFFGDDGYNDDAEFTPHGILPVIDSSME